MSTFDRRRIPAPETSYPLEPEPIQRTDEAIFLKTGLISQANGSGYIEAGGVKIACSVYGPRPKQPPYSPQGTLNLEVKFAPFASSTRRAPLRDTEPVSLSTLLTQLLLPALHLHLLPKSTVDVYLLVLESDTVAGILSAGLTVASAAVADAGIAMGGLGVGAVVSQQDGERKLDPSKEEEQTADGSVTVGVMPALNRLTNLWLSGEIEVSDACEMIEQGVAASRNTHTILAQALLEE